jgi:hypothetical protein
MDFDRMIGETCEECHGEANVDARDDLVDVDHATEDAAIREAGVDFMFQESNVG